MVDFGDPKELWIHGWMETLDKLCSEGDVYLDERFLMALWDQVLVYMAMKIPYSIMMILNVPKNGKLWRQDADSREYRW